MSKDWCDAENQYPKEEDTSDLHSHDFDVDGEIETEVVDGGWIRDDVPLTEVPAPAPSA